MAIFDPSKRPTPTDDGQGIPAGDYLLVMKSFDRKAGKDSGNPYLRACYLVIYGPARTKTFYDSLSIDMSNGGAMTRLAMFAEQAGAGAFDLDSNDEIRKALCWKPFKARVKREKSGQYINNGIARYLNKEVTEFDRKVMDTWVLDQAEKAQFEGGDGGGGGYDSNGLPDDAPPPGDDDIPF